MARKTQDVYDLVRDAIVQVPQPYTEDVIEDTFIVVAAKDTFRQRFNAARTAHGRDVTNQMIGRYVLHAVRGRAIREVPATRTDLTRNYSKLTIGE